jgi:hypothetical protein
MVLLNVDVKDFILKPLVGEYHDGRKEAIHPGIFFFFFFFFIIFSL